MTKDTINMLAGIPTLDIRSFESGTKDDRKQFVEQLGYAYETIGSMGYGICFSVYTSVLVYFGLCFYRIVYVVFAANHRNSYLCF